MGAWPQASSDESWVKSGHSNLFHMFLPSFQSEYLDTFYKVVSRKNKNKSKNTTTTTPPPPKKIKKTKTQQILAALLWGFIETDESMVHEKAVRQAEGG